eukprot:6491058-Amphidinium_carterae.1
MRVQRRGCLPSDMLTLYTHRSNWRPAGGSCLSMSTHTPSSPGALPVFMCLSDSPSSDTVKCLLCEAVRSCCCTALPAIRLVLLSAGVGAATLAKYLRCIRARSRTPNTSCCVAVRRGCGVDTARDPPSILRSSL